MSAPLLLSASQITRYSTEYEGCHRNYAFRYIAKLPDPGSPATELGKDVDDNQLQPYLKTGRPFDYTRESGYIAAAGLAWLPNPMSTPGAPKMAVQYRFELPSPSKQFGYLGFKDLWLPEGGMPGIEGDDPVVTDFKTSKDINAWSKTQKTLAIDVQAMIYATNALWEMRRQGRREVDKVHLVWLYMQTKRPFKTKRVWITVDKDHVASQFRRIDAIGQEIAQLRWAGEAALGHLGATAQSDEEKAKEFALSLEPNPAACSRFGGCPYRHICNLSPAQDIDAIDFTHASKRSLPVIMPNNVLDLFATLKAQNAAEDAEAGPVVSSPAAIAFPPMPTVLGINPPEKALPPAPAVGVVSNPPLSTLAEPVVVAPVTAPTPAKRGRPAGSKNKPADTAPVKATESVSEVLASPATTADVNTVVSDLILAATALGEAIRSAAKTLNAAGAK